MQSFPTQGFACKSGVMSLGALATVIDRFACLARNAHSFKQGFEAFLKA
ncbi:hypothetical protein [Helicobacter pylori]|nr:hypothetical protein [Helicobacter pylori]